MIKFLMMDEGWRPTILNESDPIRHLIALCFSWQTKEFETIISPIFLCLPVSTRDWHVPIAKQEAVEDAVLSAT